MAPPSIVLPVYKGYTRFAIWPVPNLINSYYGLMSKSEIKAPVLTTETVWLPFYAGHLYAGSK